MEPIKFKVAVIREFTADDVAGLLCNAFEGGSNYWAIINRVVHPGPLAAMDTTSRRRAYEELAAPAGLSSWSEFPAYLAPFLGGAVLIGSDDGDHKGILNLETIQRGLHLLFSVGPTDDDKKNNFPRFHGNNWLDGNDDATTGDVFLQLCLFGEVVYG